MWNLQFFQRSCEQAHVTSLAEQDGGRLGQPVFRWPVQFCHQPLRDSPGLDDDVVEVCADESSDGSRRPCSQRLHGDRRRGAQGCDQQVGGVEDHAGVTPAGRQRVFVGRPEVTGEPGEIGGTRAAPSVDRLVGIADRHDAMTREQRREQLGLHDTRVLVFVEQHHAVPVPVGLDRCW